MHIFVFSNKMHAQDTNNQWENEHEDDENGDEKHDIPTPMQAPSTLTRITSILGMGRAMLSPLHDTMSQKDRLAQALSEQTEVIRLLMERIEKEGMERFKKGDRLHLVKVNVCTAAVMELPNDLYEMLQSTLDTLIEIASKRLESEGMDQSTRLTEQLRTELHKKDVLQNSLSFCNARVMYLSPKH